ncbi:D-cysteine desulfhydrase family protein [candidate division KSB1 bacterium]|nr:D-cysteine desulfhydrase family protein [candidate division KSB1 bacterium]
MPIQFPRLIRLANLPTPIMPMKRLSQKFDGIDLYIKRDDLTGCALSGNKIRKLEFIVADAVESGADTLITCGGIQSNHARATAVVAAQLGLKSVLVLRGQEGNVADGNLFLDELVGAEIRTITEEAYRTRVDEIMSEIADELRTAGRKPYVIPEGASNALGTFGYIKAMQEIIEQAQQSKLAFNAIVCPVGSGGTYAGLLLGKFIFNEKIDIFGFNVCDNKAYFVKRIMGIIDNFKSRFGLSSMIREEDIRIIDGYVGKGYALSRQEEIDTIKAVAQSEGIILDPVYTGKAMVGLLDQLAHGRFRNMKSILFLHSGGIFGLYPQKGLFF